MVLNLWVHEWHPIEPLGVGYLSSSIERGGHKNVMVLAPKNLEEAVKLVNGAIKEHNPDFLNQSVIFGSHGWAIELNREVKKDNPDIISVLGGPAATFTPELLDRGFDILCRYEGEDPFLELCNAYEAGEDIGNIPNIWLNVSDKYKTIRKNDKKITDVNKKEYREESGFDEERMRFVNATRILQSGNSLDNIPEPNREIMYDELIVAPGSDPRVFASSPIKHFMWTRGCAFHCAYCHVEMMNIENKGKGPPVRRRSNELAAEEVRKVMKKHGGDIAYDQSDIMGAGYSVKHSSDFADEFSPLGYAIHGHVRFDTTSMDERIAKNLARAGVTGVHVAIEAGDEHIRNDIHKRGMTEAQIFLGAEYLTKYGIKMMTQNILGAPGETIEQMVKTYEMNKAVNPVFASASIFQPYPGTSELEYARDNGHLPDMDQNRLIDTFGFDTFYSGSILALEPEYKRWLEVFHKFFAIGVDEQLSISDLEKRMKPYLKDDSRDHELAEMYRDHRNQKDEELYGVKFKATVAA